MQQCCYSFLWRSFWSPKVCFVDLLDLFKCRKSNWSYYFSHEHCELHRINPLKKICAWMCRIQQVSRNEMVSIDAIFFCSVTRIFSQIVSSHGIRKNFLGKQPTRTCNLQQTILLDKCNKT
jgi:hypothetical protein